MKKASVQIGHTYNVKVSQTMAKVKITGESPYGGWVGTNLHTGREVRIRSAQRLRSEVELIGVNRFEQIRNLRSRGYSYETASAIVTPY